MFIYLLIKSSIILVVSIGTLDPIISQNGDNIIFFDNIMSP